MAASTSDTMEEETGSRRRTSPADATVVTASTRRKRTSPGELAILEAAFDNNPLPSREERQVLALQLGWTPRQVQVFHANRRQQAKRTKDSSRPLPYGQSTSAPLPRTTDLLGPPLLPSSGPQRAPPLARTLSAPYATKETPAPILLQRTYSADLPRHRARAPDTTLWQRMLSSPERPSAPMAANVAIGSLDWTASTAARARRTFASLAAPAMRLATLATGYGDANSQARQGTSSDEEEPEEAITPDGSMAAASRASDSKMATDIDDSAVANLLLSFRRGQL